MQVVRKIKIGPFLVISSVLALWTFLAAQPVQAHVYNTASTPSCSSLPTADTFFDSATIPISATSSSGTTTAAEGTATANSGNIRYVYAKITIPALAAGELRVFDSRSGTDPVSAAALCRRGSRIGSFSKSYSSSKHPSSTSATHTTDDEHETFQIRVPVSPGDEEYIVVIDPEGTPPTDSLPTVTIAATFHGAIESTSPLLGRQGALDPGEVESRTLVITAPGLLTLETTGSTDTVGTFGDDPEVESGGSGGNFKMVMPVETDTTGKTLKVEGQAPTTAGPYTLNMDFEVAMSTTASPTEITVADAPTWTGTVIADDDTTLQIDKSGDADYFVFTSTASGFLTVEAMNATGATRHSNTSGTLYGPDGQIATASSGGGGNHFKLRVPILLTTPYLVKVTGSIGHYDLSFAFNATENQGTSASTGDPMATVDCTDAATVNDAHEICARGTRSQQERDRYLINVMESGTLYVHTTGSTDTVGTLYGPDGGQVATNDNDGQGNNFRIAAAVNPGLHIVEVRGQNANTEGAYGLVTNFIAGGGGPVTPPGTGTETEEELRARIADLQRDLNACREPVVTDARGALGNPPNGGFRSGIGLISGWVCEAEEVEVIITSNDRQAAPVTLTVAQGTERPDTVGQCDHNDPNTGFGMTYNFNHLREGEYTITAYADGDTQIGEPRTFNVRHLTTFAIDDTTRFLRDLEAAECRVNDFPAVGEDTILEWEESTQNFMIIDAG